MSGRGEFLKEKSFRFALRMIKLNQYLKADKQEYVMSRQLLRCGTSIGANIREAQNAQSRQDFIHKLAISQKETDETLYWLELLHQSEYLETPIFSSLHRDGTEILKLLKTTILTTKQNLKKE